MNRRTHAVALTCATCLVALLALPGLASAATRYEGKGISDPKLRVEFKRADGKVQGFRFRQAPFFCTNGDSFRARMRVGTMHIKPNRRFRGHFMSADRAAAVRVRGRVRARARGFLRGVAYTTTDKCVTPRLKWSASQAD